MQLFRRFGSLQRDFISALSSVRSNHARLQCNGTHPFQDAKHAAIADKMAKQRAVIQRMQEILLAKQQVCLLG